MALQLPDGRHITDQKRRGKKIDHSKEAKAKRIKRVKADFEPEPIPEEVVIRRALRRRDSFVLNPKQAAFVEYYLIDCNGRHAYFKAFGTKKNAGSRASRLLKQPKVAAAIAKRQKTLADRLGITQEAVLREMKAIAFSNIEDYITVDGSGNAVIDLSTMEREQAAAVASISSKEYYDKGKGQMVRETQLKPYDKRTALELLGRYVGIKGFGSKSLEITTPNGPLQVEHLHTMTDEQLAQIVAGQTIQPGLPAPTIEGEVVNAEETE